MLLLKIEVTIQSRIENTSYFLVMDFRQMNL